MRKHVIVHAGYHKTGTTSIQVALTRARDRLSAAGVFYPRAGIPDAFPYGHHLLAWALQSRPHASHAFDGAGRDEVWRRLCDEIEASDAPLVVLSSEEFDRLDVAEIALLSHRLRAYRITALIFVRNLADVIESMYRTYLIHLGYSAPIARFAAELAPRLDVADMLRDWAAVTNRAPLVVNYDHDDVRTDAIGAFAAAAGIDVDLLAEHRALRENESMPAYVAETARYFRRQGVSDDVVRRWVSDAGRRARDAAGERFSSLPDALRGALDARFASEIAAIAADERVRSWVCGELSARPARAAPAVAGPLAALAAAGFHCDDAAPLRVFASGDMPWIGAIDDVSPTHIRGWLHGARDGEDVRVALAFGGRQILTTDVSPRDRRFSFELAAPGARRSATRTMARCVDAARADERFELIVEASSASPGFSFPVRYRVAFPPGFAAERTADDWRAFFRADARDPGPVAGTGKPAREPDVRCAPSG